MNAFRKIVSLQLFKHFYQNIYLFLPIIKPCRDTQGIHGGNVADMNVVILPQMVHHLRRVFALQSEGNQATSPWLWCQYSQPGQSLERIVRISVERRNTLKEPIIADCVLQPVQDGSLARQRSGLASAHFKTLRILK